MRPFHTLYAFSLVELSIVLVILGLLTGGILAGQSLIHAAELRAASAEIEKYSAALVNFQDKYDALPGDMPNAVAFWGAIAGDSSDNYTASCRNVPSADSRTCNGDGNGEVTTSGNTTSYQEQPMAWKHLANAGLIQGQYGGANTNGSVLNVAGEIPVLPESKFGANLYWRMLTTSITGSSTMFAMPKALLLHLDTAYGRRHLPEDVWNLDRKLDDGKPATGGFRSLKGGTSSPCSTRAGQAYNAELDAAAEYNLAYADPACLIYYLYSN